MEMKIMAWLFLAIAIGLEVCGTFLLKLSNGFENRLWGSASITCYAACFWFLAPAMKTLPVGLTYAIWAGVGIAAASVLGWIAFDEELALVQYGFIFLILIGVVGLRMTQV
jgi:multidrug transporter EmrE-like cation transporter